MLVDKEIRERKDEIFNSGFEEENLGCISYDIRIGKILREGSETKLVLNPGDYVMVQSEEEFTVPKDLAVTIGEKNGLMRTGLIVNGPTYFPGHHTKAYLRVFNASYKKITIEKGTKIAQMFFNQLDTIPEHPYQTENSNSFSDEVEYRGFGRYESAYQSKISEIESATKNLKSQEGKIYANILTLMGIFVSIFSLLTIDFSAISQNVSIQNLVVINVALGVVLVLFMSLIFLIINSEWTNKQKRNLTIGLMVTSLILFILLLSVLL